MKNIIFLDIDGVLNCEEVFKNGYCRYVTWGDESKHEYHQSFYPPSKKFLNDLIVLSDADIVVSSIWRHSGIEWLKKVWEYEGMEGNIIGITSSLYFKDNYSAPRGCEIEKWLKDKGFYHVNYSKKKQFEVIKESGILNYVIIDDDSDMLYKQRNHFVHVLPSPRNKKGFTEKYCNKALEIFNQKLH